MRSIIANVTPALGRQDHTTSPSASRHSSDDATRPSHPAPTVRDDREAPLLWRRDEPRKPLIWGKDQPDGMRQINTTGSHISCTLQSFARTVEVGKSVCWARHSL